MATVSVRFRLTAPALPAITTLCRYAVSTRWNSNNACIFRYFSDITYIDVVPPVSDAAESSY
ncbi:hypothetical protein WM40_10175 [Robbsia andropogonis]|uniref:Uncharacterized protein n=1 Tax=Robbsia andropogonis TaxID=28092 RepID=A0A0F5K184_9BURK|nr:hypothetical protein WM40_10175 [Robbsia andropogonis]